MIATELKEQLAAIRNTHQVIGGKWKIKIVAALMQGDKTFGQLGSEVEGISAKMLSQSLKQMHSNGLITHTVASSRRTSIAYQLTDFGHTLQPFVCAIAQWNKE